MTTGARRIMALVGGLLFGAPLGSVLDKAGVTPATDGDIGLYGAVAGVGLGLLFGALIQPRDTDR